MCRVRRLAQSFSRAVPSGCHQPICVPLRITPLEAVVALMIYAAPADLATWLAATAPANADQLLRSATMIVAVATNRDPYTDTPSSAEAPILRDATCAQAATWVALGTTPAAQGLDVRVVAESKIGTADVKRVAPAAATVTEVSTGLAPEARAVLLAGGLLWQPVPVGADPCDGLPRYGLDAQHRWYGSGGLININDLDPLYVP